ncbi:Zn-ribbon domain-containing OB-fold protein [Tropicibacter naphthalenivorans]|uniref:Putative nucleic-acid-binding protein containing a Zn-ribbon n=1 Tax=Tropicibacter naphthalenivorans TaxID=441103 RepID=A0A0P1GH83_9RHOB|nr:Zn-ribbon domain-containing OB-fold protein [Tropicibacter naphthalenivorans]CUH81328.1 putative nucleic-acid-binding protein containing a Zn-ribbon [Tropicibacter naphthalenivorans]SMC98406.1 hypothetical protein SAMN04488093_108128 [Tropicibacter naphthalenivorans]
MSLANGDSARYFAAAQEGRLVFQTCADCGAVQHPPRHHCATCWEANLSFEPSSGKGTVESFTIVRRAPLPAYRDKVPYVVASILVEEGPRMIATLTGADALDVAIGDTVTVAFEANVNGDTLPVFARA